MTDKQRKPGFYWTSFHPQLPDEVAKWVDGHWCRTGLMRKYPPEEVRVLSDRIPPPTKRSARAKR